MRARHGYPQRVACADVTAAEDADDCGRVLRELRAIKDVSAAELAARAGVSERDVAEFEAGRIIPARPAFGAYLRVLGYA
jgi:transcriptional regulator with XRE-family HTH domain